MSQSSELEQSLKSREVEGALDLLFYRPLGLRLARLFAAARLTPDHVTVLGAMAGVAAGHLYFYRSLSLNLVGMGLHILSNLLDNVDGQLARLTKRQSETGKVVDGIGDHVVFLSVYIHLCLRHVAAGGSNLIWLLALGAALSHAAQSAAAEFCRDAFARFASGRSTALQSSRDLRARQDQNTAANRILLALHANYLATQEKLLPLLARLRDRALAQFAGGTPDWFAEAYRSAHGSLARSSRFLGTNTRMLVLFLFLFLRQPSWYFVVELTILNGVLCWLIARENKASRQLLQMIEQRAGH